MDGEGILDVEWAGTREFLAWDVALWLNYANDPLVVRIKEPGEPEREGPALIEHHLAGNLVGALGLFEWLQIGLDLPLTLYQTQADSVGDVAETPPNLSAAGTGDLRLRPKFQLLFSEVHFVDLALIAMVTLPTASSHDYLGEAIATFEPELVVSKSFDELRAALNVAYRLRPAIESVNLLVDDEIIYRIGIAYDFNEQLSVPVELSATLSGAFSVSKPFEDANETAVEMLFGAAHDVHERVRLFAAAGVGLHRGFGTPDFRVLAGVRFHTPAAKDRDQDGLPDDEDTCPDDPEDKDGFEDENGCPDPDNDQDDVLDINDGAPNDPEDKDAFEDEDGVPDPDNDRDEVLDIDDLCPLEPGAPDNRGCPFGDQDNDGLIDKDDDCPDAPEDEDGFEDENGCPDPDNDQDGIEDTADHCPLEPGVAEAAGCPMPDRDGDQVGDSMDNCPDVPGKVEYQGCAKPQLVKLTTEKIDIVEKVYFDTGKASIKQRSFELLDNIASVLADHPEIALVRIEGHTDARGNAEYNLRLSHERAKSVREYLVGNGIAAERLEAKGYGEEKPLRSNATKAGRATNRRVEFLIPNARAAGFEQGEVEPVAK